MANTLTNVMPKILANGLLALREAAVMPRLVTTEYGDAAAMKGSQIEVPISKPGNPRDVSPSVTFSAATDTAPGIIIVPLDQWKHDDFYLTDKEMVQVNRDQHFVPLAMSEVVKGLANLMDSHIHDQYKAIYGFAATPGTTPFSTIKHVTDARVVLNNQLAPVSNRKIVINSDAEGQALQLAAISDFEKTGDARVKIEGELGRKLGFDWLMANAWIGHTNHYDDATTLAATNEVASLPIENVQNSHVVKVFRANSSTTVVDLTMSANVSSNVFMLAGTNIAESDTYQLQASVSAITGSYGALDTGAISTGISTRYKQALNVFASTVSARYWRLTLTGTTNPIDIGRLWLSPIVRPAISVAPGYGLQVVDTSIVRQTDGGQVLRYQRPKLRRAVFNWSQRLDDTDAYALFQNIDHGVGAAKDVLFCLDEEHAFAADNTILGTLEQFGPLTADAAINSTAYRVIELG